MDAALGYPSRDPHGELIPRPDLSMPDDHSMPLLGLRPPQGGIIFRVQDTNPELLVHLEELGLMPGTKIEVKDYPPFDQKITLLEEGQKKNIVIGTAISSRIFIETDSTIKRFKEFSVWVNQYPNMRNKSLSQKFMRAPSSIQRESGCANGWQSPVRL